MESRLWTPGRIVRISAGGTAHGPMENPRLDTVVRRCRRFGTTARKFLDRYHGPFDRNTKPMPSCYQQQLPNPYRL
ncbi:hypothetical protein GWI33_012688 [Rhynchophorus ferrugineus]|nr:hypothetical protein GWI33_012688 [Rhynchophorus ferrugineus]